MANVKGNLQFETGDGEVSLRGVEGSVHASTGDGNVEVNGRFNVLNLHTGDGNIDAEVNATSTPRPGRLLRSGDGNIRLKLPRTISAPILMRKVGMEKYTSASQSLPPALAKETPCAARSTAAAFPSSFGLGTGT